ncbi:glycosyltransferase family 9 protein [Fluviispira multicolorata]|uniref:Glycosyl transferase family 9 n=1 Tax=Fluviispira multicolorata TaxID=2654512 RepID=A0A833N712_9BACT|nr:glycosyltransferase family 9 protein [Fluviispira multicolorata]KAB8031088.1 glycosyl transferase family 9 [Fluviispira multicolorata]
MNLDSFKRILISRTDNIGDVILTIPMAGAIKKQFPNSKVLFLGKKYTKPIIDCCEFIDEFYDWEEIKKNNEIINCDSIIHVFPNKEISKYSYNLKILNRIGTNRRIYHWIYCNKKVNLSRKNSTLHEAQLNLKLLSPLNINTNITTNELVNYYGFTRTEGLPDNHKKLIDKNKFNLILHPKSKGSAREWPPEKFVKLANLLPKEKYNIFLSGTESESEFIKDKIIKYAPHVRNIAGIFNLSQFISFIKECDGLIAASTGPLHIAAALGIHALGIYPPIKEMVPARWGPLGKQAEFILGINKDKSNKCTIKCNIINNCSCINNIESHTVFEIIERWNKTPAC